MADPVAEAGLALIVAMGIGNIWALIGWFGAYKDGEKIAWKKIMRTELVAIGALVIAIAMHVTPDQGMNFFMLYGGIPLVDKLVSGLAKQLGYTGNGNGSGGDETPAPPAPPA